MSESTNYAGDEKYWSALATVTAIGPAAMLRLYDRFEDMSLAWSASRSELIEAGITRDRAARVVEERRRIDPDLEMERVESANARLITFGSAAFPPLLREIPSPPAVLYVQGGFTEQDLTRTIAMVGTRRISPYGRQITSLLAADLAAAGLTVISGLAFGVDGAAHRAALDAGGRTVAVLGTGIDIVYPAKHRGLAEEVAKSGAVVTEFPPGTKPAGENFPQRNRIISGLSMATLVTEAPVKSGALITASFANHQGRDVLAVPGDVFSVNSAGCNALIRDGAVMARNADDALETINFAARTIQLPFEVEPPPPMREDERQVAQVLSLKPIHRDEITRSCGLPASKVAALLTIMEMKGLAKDVGGGHYVQGRIHSNRA
ncbi:MAG: DNA-processing protein DprA [Chloroflexi bacterium]|nr:DNA-processing protein DprA [Chloroflexota bacterium]MCY3938512.1 DNA-processing protein DprA [Chloroflexota bacterium]